MPKRTLISFSLALAMLVVACDEPVGPAQTGSILLRFVIPDPPAAAPTDSAEAADDEASEPERQRERPDAEPEGDVEEVRVDDTSRRPIDDEWEIDRSALPSESVSSNETPLRAASAGNIETARAIISGPTDTVVALNVTATEINGNIQGLLPGSYTVSVEAFIGGAVDYFGQAAGVQVQSEQTATATIAFASFRPDLSGFGLTSTAAFSFNVTFPAVSGATSYDVLWDTDPGFGANPDSSTASGPSVTVTVNQATTHYLRVRSRNASSTSVGRYSDTRSVDVISARTGTPSAPTGTLGDTLAPGSADTTVAIDVNVDVPGIQNWFMTPVCMGDTLTFAAVAANLSPPSPLDTYLRIVQSLPGTDTIATNDDSNGTDAEITMVVPETDSVRILVGGQNNSVGHFELRVRRAAGLGRSPIGSCLGIDPDRLAFRTIAGATAGSPFTVEVEIQDQFGAVVQAASQQVTLNLGSNPGSVVFHISDCCTNPMRYRYVDHKVPTIYPDLANPVLNTEMLGIAWDPNADRFVAVGYIELFSIDPVSGTTDTILIGITTSIRGITFVNSGTQLIGADRFSNLIVDVDPVTGAMTPLGAVTGINANTGFNGLATDPTDGRVYAISKISGQNRELVVFDPTTLAGVTIGTLAVPGMAAIAFTTDGRLLGLGGDGSTTHPATLVEVDKTTGATLDGLTGMGTSLALQCCGETMTTRPVWLRGTVSQIAVNGVATFSDLQLDATETGYTIQASAMGLTGGESAPFSVSAGQVTNLPSRIDLPRTAATIFTYGDTAQFTATVIDADQNPVGATVSWASFNPTIADVDASGLVSSNDSAGTTGFVPMAVWDPDSVVVGFPFVTISPMPVALLTPSTFRLSETLDSFNLHIPGFAFDTINIGLRVPSVAELQSYASVVLWMNASVLDPIAVGDNVTAYLQSGGNAVLGTFFYAIAGQWGALDALSPYTLTGVGNIFGTDSLDVSGMTAHPLTNGLTRVLGTFKPDVVVASGATNLANWASGFPMIGYRELSSGQRVVGVTAWVNNASQPVPGPPAAPAGDWWRMWQNAMGWAGNGGTLFPKPPAAYTVAPVSPAIMRLPPPPPNEIPFSQRRPRNRQ